MKRSIECQPAFKLLTILLVAFTLVFTSCEKDNEPVTNHDILMSTKWSLDSYVKNGDAQVLTGESSMEFTKDLLTTNSYDAEGNIEERIYDYQVSGEQITFGNGGCLEIIELTTSLLKYTTCENQIAEWTWVPK